MKWSKGGNRGGESGGGGESGLESGGGGLATIFGHRGDRLHRLPNDEQQ